MDQLIETIRRAVAEDAPATVKEAGAKACKAILAALETEPGKPLAAGVPSSPLAGLDAGQALDLLIGKLRTMVPADEGKSAAGPGPALRIPFVPAPRR